MQLRAMRTSLVIALLYWLCAVAAYVPTRSARTAVRAERGMEVLYDPAACAVLERRLLGR